MLVIGIDPGTGRSSPTGIAVYHSETRKIVYTARITTEFTLEHHVIKDLADKLGKHLKYATKLREVQFLVGCETFVIKGKAGQILQRLIGAFLTRIPFNWTFISVFNTTMKRIVGGHGKAEKIQVAEELLKQFAKCPYSVNYIKDLIDMKRWDETDALGIALCAETLYIGEQAREKVRERKYAAQQRGKKGPDELHDIQKFEAASDRIYYKTRRAKRRSRAPIR